jgi:hypothetical protein
LFAVNFVSVLLVLAHCSFAFLFFSPRLTAHRFGSAVVPIRVVAMIIMENKFMFVFEVHGLPDGCWHRWVLFVSPCEERACGQ